MNSARVLKDLDYEKLKKSLGFLVDRDLPPEILNDQTHPVRILERMEKKRMNGARRGLIVAIADMIEATQDLSPARVYETDAELEKIGAYTLTFLRLQLTRRGLKEL